MDALIASRSGIVTHVRRYTLSEIWTLLSNDSVVSAHWNRPEVAKRKGDETELMTSIIQGFSISLFLGFWNGKAVKIDDIKPTKENPIHITEGGHRLRWLKKILNGETAVCDMSIQDIKTKNKTLYDFIMNYKIIIEIKTHSSGTVSEKYMMSEYNAVNTHGELLKYGETRSTDDNVNKLVEVFDSVFAHRKAKTDGKSRQDGIGLKHRFIRCMESEDFRMMAKNNFTLPTVSDTNYSKIESVIKNLGNIESSFLASVDKKIKTKLSKSLDDKLHGTMFYGLIKEPHTASEIIRSLYAKACENAEVFDHTMDSLNPVGNNGGGRFKEADYFPERWRILKNVVNPISHDNPQHVFIDEI